MEITRLLEFVKIRTSGMQPVSVYREYYDCARALTRGHVADLGTGQGGSTIAYALGLLAGSGGTRQKVLAFDQFYQYKTGPHPYNASELGDRSVELNLESFRSNLAEFNVNQIVDVFPGKLEVLPEALIGAEIGLLSLDTDGYIDRDFALFFDNVSPAGVIVIDDYADLVNPHGRKNLAAVKGMDESEIRGFVAKKRESPLSGGARILGKHILTYRLTQLFAQGNTAFCRKLAKGSFENSINTEALRDVKVGIEREFIERALTV
jgi:hypothetical protein